jgi:hypothetical protein
MSEDERIARLRFRERLKPPPDQAGNDTPVRSLAFCHDEREPLLVPRLKISPAESRDHRERATTASQPEQELQARVSQLERSGEQATPLGRVHPWCLVRRLPESRGHDRAEVSLEVTAFSQIAEERADSRELAPDRRSGQPTMLERRQPSPERHLVELRQLAL